MAGGEGVLCPSDGKKLSKASLYRHQLSHNAKAGQNECEICKKTFKSSYDLNKHVQYGPHSGKTFTCEECSKSFPRKETLTRHVQSRDIPS